MINRINCFFLLFFIAYSFAGMSQPTQRPYIKNIILPEESILKIASLPPQISEASGLAITNNTNFWTHNDGGNPVLFCLDSNGQLTKTLHLNHKNKGWEDLATDEKGNLYIGSFGNNKNDRRDLKIFRIANPDSIQIPIFTADVIHFSYEDQSEFPPLPSKRNFDCDAFIIMNESIFLFTKNRSLPFNGFTRIYKLPATPGEHKALLIDSLYLGNGAMMDNWITGADISNDKSTLALIGHSSIWIVKYFKGENFSSGQILRLSSTHYTHKAGVAFAGKNLLYVVDEKELGLLGGNLYKIRLTSLLNHLEK